MNEDELREYRTLFREDTLRLLVLIFALELHGLPYFSPFGQQAVLMPDSRQLAEFLFDTEEEYRNYAIEKVDIAKKDSFREDWRQNYLN